VPSAHEQGLAHFDVSSWSAFFLPKRTPEAIVRKLHDAVIATLETPSVQERLNELGYAIAAPERRSPEHLQQLVESEIKRWAEPIKAANLTGE